MTEVSPAMDAPVWWKRYPPSVSPHVEIPPLLLHELVANVVRANPTKMALIYYGRRWTYEEFWGECGRFAAALRRDGVHPGDRVAIYLPNCPLYPIALFGALRAGAVVAQVSPLYLGDDLVALLQDAQPKAIVTLEILYPNLTRVRGRHAVPIAYVARLRDFYPARTRPFVNVVLRRKGRPTDFPSGPEVRPWSAVRRLTDPPPADWKGDPATAVALLQYTGGTTGRSKGAMLTHRNLIANVLQLNSWNVRRQPGHEVLLASIPLFHIYGLTVALLTALCDGSAVVLQTLPDVPELLKLIDRYQPTQFPGVPALYQALLRHPETPRHQLRSIRFCLSGSAPLPVEVQRQFEAMTGATVIEGYGLSETAPATHANPTQGERRPGSIGVPLPDTYQRVVDLEDPSVVLEVDQPGELAVRGPQVMLGYYHQPEETEKVLRDGWFLTGDVARVDADGFAYIVDRKKDMINVGGLKVWPREVEEVLFRHPAVQDVAAIGVPDPEMGEVVKAFVVRKPGATVSEGELIGFVRNDLAHYKAPRSIEFRESLPRSGVQKVLRRALRESGSSPPGASSATGGPGRPAA